MIALGALFGNLFFQQLAQLVTSLPTTVTQLVGWINQHLHLQLDATTVADRFG